MKNIKLSNGVEVPIVGFGTWNLPKDRIDEIINSVYDLGYRKFDTAWKYNNERELASAFSKIKGLNRSDIFITTKLYIYQCYYGRRIFNHYIRKKSFEKAFYEQCNALGTDYIDLYLIHWPFPMFKSMWKDIVKIYQKGHIRSIGVCSFEPKHFEELAKISDIVPMVNQIEVSPYNTRKETIAYCQERGIAIEAYSAFGGAYDASLDLMKDETLLRIAQTKGKTVAQIINRWLIQQDLLIIPRSKSPKHQEENISIFDFELTDDEMFEVDSLNKDLFVWGNPKLEYSKF